MFAVSNFLVAIFAAQAVSGIFGLSASARKRTQTDPPAGASSAKLARVGSDEPVEEESVQPVVEMFELNKKISVSVRIRNRVFGIFCFQ